MWNTGGHINNLPGVYQIWTHVNTSCKGGLSFRKKKDNLNNCRVEEGRGVSLCHLTFVYNVTSGNDKQIKIKKEGGKTVTW